MRSSRKNGVSRAPALAVAEWHLDSIVKEMSKEMSLEEHLELLRGSDHVVLALDGGLNAEVLDTDPAPDGHAAPDGATDRVVGFITAISDGVLSTYIPLLEVLPDYRGQGIGTEFVRCLLHKLNGLYMVDVMCDPGIQPFYARLGMLPSTGMMIRKSAVMIAAWVYL